MSMQTFGNKLNAGDPDAVAWWNRQCEIRSTCESRHAYPHCNIIASEQIFMVSASERRCYICGCKTTHRQTTGISFPPVAKSGWICAECDAD